VPHMLPRPRLLLTIFDTNAADCNMNALFDAGVGFNIRRARPVQNSTRASGSTFDAGVGWNIGEGGNKKVRKRTTSDSARKQCVYSTRSHFGVGVRSQPRQVLRVCSEYPRHIYTKLHATLVRTRKRGA
jgi:hypothetical protein